jgi:hypothetical protein
MVLRLATLKFVASCGIGLLFLFWCLRFGKQNSLMSPLHSVFSYKASLLEYKQRHPSILYSNEVTTVVKDPDYFHLGELLSNWPADAADLSHWQNSAAHPNKGNGVPRFDFMNIAQREVAKKYRDAELPFIMYNIPSLAQAADTYFHGDTLAQRLRALGDLPVEQSTSHKFIYYSTERTKTEVTAAYPEWTPPQTIVHRTFDELLAVMHHKETKATTAATTMIPTRSHPSAPHAPLVSTVSSAVGSFSAPAPVTIADTDPAKTADASSSTSASSMSNTVSATTDFYYYLTVSYSPKVCLCPILFHVTMHSFYVPCFVFQSSIVQNIVQSSLFVSLF